MRGKQATDVVGSHSLSPAEQREFAAIAEKRQMKDFMTVRTPSLPPVRVDQEADRGAAVDVLQPRPEVRQTSSSFFSFSSYSEHPIPRPPHEELTRQPRCFDDCINDFTSKAVSQKEEKCVNNCVDKFLKSSERLGQRFQEQNQAMMQGGLGR